LKLIFDGDTLTAKETPSALGMENDDMVDASVN